MKLRRPVRKALEHWDLVELGYNSMSNEDS